MCVCVCLCVCREREKETEKAIYFKELGHVIMEADNSKSTGQDSQWETQQRVDAVTQMQRQSKDHTKTGSRSLISDKDIDILCRSFFCSVNEK